MECHSYRLRKLEDALVGLEIHADDLESLFIRIEMGYIPTTQLETVESRIEELLTILSEAQATLLKEKELRQ